MKELTQKQERVLNLIRTSIALTGQSPTVREMCREIGVQSSCTVQRHLDALERKGFVSRRRYKYRSIDLTEQGGALPSYSEQAAEIERLRGRVEDLEAELDRVRRFS